MKSILRTFICLSLFLSGSTLFAEPELKGSAAELSAFLNGVSKTVVVSGESELKVEADKASVSLRVRTENKSFRECLRLNQEIRSKVIAFINERGMKADRIQSAKFSSTPKHAVFGDKVKSYEVENFFKVTVLDEKEFQIVAAAADNWPEVHYEGAEFEYADKEAAKMKALRQACENATARKKVFEEALGIKLLPKKFSEIDSVKTPGSINAPGYSLSYANLPKESLSDRNETAPGTISETMSSFGEMTFKANIAVEYSLEGK